MHSGMVLGILRAFLTRTRHQALHAFEFVMAPPDPGWSQLAYDDAYQTAGRLFEALWREWIGDAKDRDEMIGCLGDQLNLWLPRALKAQVLSPEARIADTTRPVTSADM